MSFAFLFIPENDLFGRREFSLVLTGDLYLRYQFVDSLEQFRSLIVSRNPIKIDIGPVYMFRPGNPNVANMLDYQTEQRELIFDIDMTDYDEVRTCCSGADICPKCWPFMIVAAKILNAVLTEDFGYKNLLWVFSGRRGIHCWVADKRARLLNDDMREAIVSYINIFEGGQFKAKKVEINGSSGPHPALRRAVKIIDLYFDSLMLEKQDFMGTASKAHAILDLTKDKELERNFLDTLHESDSLTSKHRWNHLKTIVQSSNPQRTKSFFTRQYLLDEIKLQFCYPRLDINVTKSRKHLLKAPFCVHPKTGLICVPFDIEAIDSFDPFKVPSITELCNELDMVHRNQLEQRPAKRAHSDEDADGDLISNTKSNSLRFEIVKQTSLAPSLKVFENFIQELLSDL